jgi:hypothetical protein
MMYARGARSCAQRICIAHTAMTADNASLKRGGILDQGTHSASSTPSDRSLLSPWRGGAPEDARKDITALRFGPCALRCYVFAQHHVIERREWLD